MSFPHPGLCLGIAWAVVTLIIHCMRSEDRSLHTLSSVADFSMGAMVVYLLTR